MKRCLRSKNSCSPIQNIFTNSTSSQFSELLKQIPEQFLNKLQNKKNIHCDDILNLQSNPHNQKYQIQKAKKAFSLFESKCQSILQKLRHNQERVSPNPNSYFDDFINEEELGRKKIKSQFYAAESIRNEFSFFQFKSQFEQDSLHAIDILSSNDSRNSEKLASLQKLGRQEVKLAQNKKIHD